MLGEGHAGADPQPTGNTAPDLSNPLLDLLGPAAFGPALAFIFWNATATSRVLVAAGGYTVLTLVSGLALWMVARRAPALYETGEKFWSVMSGVLASALPWVIDAQTRWGHYAVALVFIALMSSDTLFSALRPNRMWKTVLIIATLSTSTNLFVAEQYAIAVSCFVFGIHIAGGHDAVQELVRSLRVQSQKNAALAETDPLTGLANRRGLTRFMEQANADGLELTVAAIDIDDFKQINDRHGHTGGDVALIALARYLEDALGDDWLAVRSGGDEFTCVTATSGVKQARAALRRVPSQFFENAVIPIRISVGLAEGAAEDTLLADASAALRLSKQQGKHRITVVDAELRASLAEARRLGIELVNALEEGQIDVYGQPIVKLEPNGGTSIHSFECLARWTTQSGTMVPPSIFIPIIEDQRLTRVLGESILTKAARFASGIDSQIGVSVNVSASHFIDASFVPFIHATIERFELAARRLTIEVTESEDLPSAEEAWLVARQLDEMGVGLAIDDFGTGFASLERLVSFPCSQLKLDRSIAASATEVGIRHVLGGFARMSEASGTEIVAEGIETAEQEAAIRSIGLPLAQGYLFGRPRPVGELLLEHGRRDLENTVDALQTHALIDNSAAAG